MIEATRPFEQAIEGLDRNAIAGEIALAESQRKELLERFPRSRWAEMTLEEYALGHDRYADSFCYWMEFRSPELGSIRGGSALKTIVYKHREKPGWHFPKMFTDERTAWEHLRSDFIRAFELADHGEWAETDELEALAWGPALKLKTLHLYFPDQILPVYSTDHLRRYLSMLKGTTTPSSAPVSLNRAVLAALRERGELQSLSTQELMRLLYRWSDPRGASRVFKIAPGENAMHWDDCLQNGYICVGWDEIGDLRDFESKLGFRERFQEVYAGFYKHRQNKITEKANELWTLMDLEPGDLLVANQGLTRVLAVGEVMEPGYVHRDDREQFKHTVAVKWDTSYAKTIPAQKRWQFVTVAKIPDALLETILGPTSAHPATTGVTTVPVDPLYLRIANGLKRKGQLILYGPPGTGKTYTARRFAVWWLLRASGEAQADAVLADSERFRETERRFSTLQGAQSEVGPLTRVTFHPSYTYEDFIEGFRPMEMAGGGLSLRLEDGVFKRVCRAAQANPKQPYLVLVDEINRGNVAKILGDLLTLLERDKRGLSVFLPQSKEAFEVPPNVYLLGTMNTADRSIKLLDAALRRRFAFVELMPDVDLLRGASVGELALDVFLAELNRRIATAEGREKQIGHAYLLDEGEPVTDPSEFVCRFREEILPLLQEYCYDEYTTLAGYIGTELVDQAAGCLRDECLEDPEQLVAALAKEFCAAGSTEG